MPGLRFTTDADPGLRRRRRGRGFSYSQPNGRPVRDPATLARVRGLAIPPAWTEVWICRSPDGHLQATGRDARGRKQYRYHAAFRRRRDGDQFARMRRFAEALPRLRRRVAADLVRDGLPREKVLAATVRLLERTLIRVGNDEYARTNRSFGISTLRNRHAEVVGSEIRFRFQAKSGRLVETELRDRRLATIVRRCRDLPGQALFAYREPDGTVHDVGSDDINAYIREAAGDEAFSAKDFRTWAGTVLAFRALIAGGEPVEDGDVARTARLAVERGVREAVRATADRLGNSPAVARASYIDPGVIDAYMDEDVRQALLAAGEPGAAPNAPPRPREEAAVMRVLEAGGKDLKHQGRKRQTRPATLPRAEASPRRRRPGSSSA